MKFHDSDTKGFQEIGLMNHGLLLNQDLKPWKYNQNFFTRAILSPNRKQN